MGPRGPNRSTGVYSNRHKRRLVQQQIGKSNKRVNSLISEIIRNRTPSNHISVEADPAAIADAEGTTCENAVSLEKVSSTVLTPLSNHIDNGSAIESSETNQNTELEYDIVDDECICKDEEYDYRYSDDEDSEDENGETVINDPELGGSTAEVCSYISEKLKNVFAQWTVTCGISKSSQKIFLQNIRRDIPSLSLPLDPRTLVKAPKIGTIHKIKGGDYCHFGLKTVLEKIVSQRQLAKISNRNIDFLINIDGAPLGKDSVKNLWPILTSENVMKKVYIIGVYCGKSKPEDVDEFLSLFVQEAKYYIEHGFQSHKFVYNILIDGLIFDAPAKAYILGVKCHSGYFSCTKCEIKGIYNKCVCFPGGVEVLRTDDEFRTFHRYREQGYQLRKTIVNEIPKLGLVSQVPLDPMHLVYVGCTRKFFLIWRFSSTKYRLSIGELNIISNAFIAMRPFVPYEFARKPRDLKDIKQFKATELRQIELYTGVVALKNNVAKAVYDNFVTLHVAISIYSNPKLCYISQWIDYARKLGTIYVREFRRLYGSRYVSHNVHNVEHLADDVNRYGELENFSAFRFENFIAQFKRLLRSGNNVSEQLLNRCAELEILQDEVPRSINSIELRQSHCAGPVPDFFKNIKEYKVGIFASFKLNCDDGKNNYVQIDNSHDAQISNIISCGSDVYIVGRLLQVVGPLYEQPCSSSTLGINILRPSSEKSRLQYWNIKQITAKLFIIPYKENIVAFPMLHTIRTTV